METFFELMILDRRIRYNNGVNVRIHWGGEVENSIWMNPDAEHIFGRLIMAFDVVVSTQDMYENCGGDSYSITEAEKCQEWIYSYYKEFRVPLKPRETKQIVHVEVEQMVFLEDL